MPENKIYKIDLKGWFNRLGINILNKRLNFLHKRIEKDFIRLNHIYHDLSLMHNSQKYSSECNNHSTEMMGRFFIGNTNEAAFDSLKIIFVK